MVVYKKGHKNSKGESAPWTIVSHETGKILSSHTSKKKAEEHLRQMEYYKHVKHESVFPEYLDNLPAGNLFEAIRQGYSVLFEASETDAYRYFAKEVATLDQKTRDYLENEVYVMLRDQDRPIDPTASWVHMLFKQFIADFGLRNNEALYFAPGMARIVFHNIGKFHYEPSTAQTQMSQALTKLVQYIAMGHKGEYTRYLVDKTTGQQQTLGTLKEKYWAALRSADRQKVADLDKQTYTPSDYEIIELTDFDTARQFSKYATAEKWCHLADEGMFEFYRQGGYARLYLAVKPGFEKLRPGDKGYGASMLGIDIGPNNKMLHCNNRYNHAKDPELDNQKNPPGDDRYDINELSQLLGGPYYKFCPYYSKEEMARMGLIDFEDVAEKIEEGADPAQFGKVITDKLPEGYSILNVPISNKLNIPHTAIIGPDRKLVGDEWFDYIKVVGGVVFVNVYDEVTMSDMWSPISLKTGNVNDDIRADSLRYAYKGGCIIGNDQKYNAVSAETGELVLDEWMSLLEQNIDGTRYLIAPEYNSLRTNLSMLNHPYVADEYLRPVPGLQFTCIFDFDRFDDDDDIRIAMLPKRNLLSRDFTHLVFDPEIYGDKFKNIVPGLPNQVILYTSESSNTWLISDVDGNFITDREYTGKIVPRINDNCYEISNDEGQFTMSPQGEVNRVPDNT